MESIEKDDHFIPDGMNVFGCNVKRIGDRILTFDALIAFSSSFLLCYITVKREGGGPVISKQGRIDRFGRLFNIYKFHNVKPDAEKYDSVLYAGEKDFRMTKVGRFLRGHHLDELLQLRNMLCSDMTFTGPRPERQPFVDQIIKENLRYRYSFQIRLGATLYATLYDGYTDTLEKMPYRLRYGLFYLEHRSWDFDIKILPMTFTSIVSGKKF